MKIRVFLLIVLTTVVFGLGLWLLACDNSSGGGGDDEIPTCDELCERVAECYPPCVQEEGCLTFCAEEFTGAMRSCASLKTCSQFNDCICDEQYWDDDVDDDTGDDDDDDDIVDDDDNDDNDDNDDSVDDDDDDDDDTIPTEHPPILSNGHWNPTTTTLMDIPGYAEDYYASTIEWSVCDEGNDLLPSGRAYILQAGTSESFISAPYLPWSDLHDPPTVDLSDVDNCGSPVQVGMTILFAPQSDPTAAPPGTYCADIKATDSNGDESNKLQNMCVTHNP